MYIENVYSISFGRYVFLERFFLSDFCFKGSSTYVPSYHQLNNFGSRKQEGKLFIFICYPEFKMIFMKLILRILIV